MWCFLSVSMCWFNLLWWIYVTAPGLQQPREHYVISSPPPPSGRSTGTSAGSAATLLMENSSDSRAARGGEMSSSTWWWREGSQPVSHLRNHHVPHKLRPVLLDVARPVPHPQSCRQTLRYVKSACYDLWPHVSRAASQWVWFLCFPHPS